MSQPAGHSALDQTVEQVKHHAAQFREAIERCNRLHLTFCMREFPLGSCGDATPLLGTYLAEKGLGSFQYALGTRASADSSSPQSHAWLEGGDLIVDITADQFPEISAKIIVTRQSDWHATFERDPLVHAADYRAYDPHTVVTLGQVYSAILRGMEPG